MHHVACMDDESSYAFTAQCGEGAAPGQKAAKSSDALTASTT